MIRRFRIVLITSAIIACLCYNYIFYLSTIWSYQGFPEFNAVHSMDALIISIISSLIFAWILPPRIIRYSHFVTWFLFFFMFVPTVVIVAMQGFEDDGGIRLVLCVVLSFALIAFVPELFVSWKQRSGRINLTPPISPSHRPPPQWTNFSLALLFVYASIIVASVFVFGSSMKIVSFYEVYELRSNAAEIAGSSSLMAYLLGWLTRVIAPFMIAVGLIYKRKLFLVLGVAAIVASYSINGAKSSLIIIALLFVFHKLVLSSKDILAERIGLVLLIGISLPLIVVTLYGVIVSPALDIVVSQTLKRAIATQGQMLGIYSDFFSQNPLTYYSHIKPINLLVEYPYGKYSLGQVVAYDLTRQEWNASAGFWATDGIAALGYSGIVLIGLLLGLFLSVLNKLYKEDYFRFLCLSSLATIWMLVDTSVFRTILTGGWPLHFMIVYFYWKEMRVLPLAGPVKYNMSARRV